MLLPTSLRSRGACRLRGDLNWNPSRYGGAEFNRPSLDAFFCLGILRKICNHPDLLAQDPEVRGVLLEMALCLGFVF